jgi:hypothetical protein
MNLKNLMAKAGISNDIDKAIADAEAAKEKKIQEMAGAVTRIVLNQAIAEAKTRAAERDRLLINTEKDGAEKK